MITAIVAPDGRIIEYRFYDQYNYPEVQEGMVEVDVPPEVAANPYIYGNYIDGQFVLSEFGALSLADRKHNKTVEINQAYELEVFPLYQNYSPYERETWPVQILESWIIKSGSTSPTPWIDNAADERGITREQLADKIAYMDTQYRIQSGRLTGKRQRLGDLINDAQDQDDLDAIVW